MEQEKTAGAREARREEWRLRRGDAVARARSAGRAMIAGAGAGRIFLRRAPTDMRKSFDGISGIVRGELGRDPLSGVSGHSRT